ncbi:hypothetical protein [Paenibacillus faecalis]|uniref:hypothetical protein n=1 Tax=Paenibacillus faecalis TaxID=2079532 RepID=UPI000D0E99EC|nr:hypothetical protein [Paenibacillus faecalis]
MNYQIQYATRMKEIIFLSLVFSIVMFQIGVWTQQSFPVLFYTQMAINVVVVTALVVELYARMVRRGVEIQRDSDEIRIHGEVIKVEDIEMIQVTGCRKAAFFFKLKGRKRPWISRTFKFADANCEGIREILKWAEGHNIAVHKIGPQSPMVNA